jgi:hypothetical protein
VNVFTSFGEGSDMSDVRSACRRQFLLSIAGAVLALPLAGWLGDDLSDPLGQQPYPPELIGDEEFLDALDKRIEDGRFPNPDAELVPELTKARFVADAARDADQARFADRIDNLRSPVFEPLIRFEAASTLIQHREQLDEDEFNDIVSKAGLKGNISFEDDPALIIEEGLTERDKTFFDYPAPPLHVIESAETRGRELMESSPEKRAQSVDEQHHTYVQQRATVEAIVIGARDLAVKAYDDVIDRIHAESSSNWTYEDEEEYAEVIAFNASLAAESMLEHQGEIITPP